MKKFRTFKPYKCIALLLLSALALSLTACGQNQTSDHESVPLDPYAGQDHTTVSDQLYTNVLGDFEAAYAEAEAADSISRRFALMAVAEAKLLGSAVLLPSVAGGGRYAISRVAPYTSPSVLWGSDSDRLATSVVVKGEPLTPAVREELRALWQASATGEEYLSRAADHLVRAGRTLSDSYTLPYTADVQTWDVHATSNASDSQVLVNTYEGLLEYDVKDRQVPALCTSYSVSPDGLTYTFRLRPGVFWVDHQGSRIEEVTADSFVCGFQHMLDARGGLEYLVDGIIKGASSYLSGEITDFEGVGVKALDTYTVAYTLEAPTSYFLSMLGYGVLAPLSRAYFTSRGGVFGQDAFRAVAGQEQYTYGTSHETIAYCGPYLVSSVVSENTMICRQNPAYHTPARVRIKTLTYKFLAGKQDTESYDLMVDGTLSGTSLNSASVARARADGRFDKYAYVAPPNATSYPVFFNLYRTQYGNFNDESVAPSTLSRADRARANLAMQNHAFRLCLCRSLDRGSYNAATVGDDLKFSSLVNSYTPGNFVKLDEEVTIPMGDGEKTYPAGTRYGEILQDALDADGMGVTVWDPTADGGLGASYGFDGWYDPAAAREHLARATEELAALGVTLSRETPLRLELPYYEINDTFANRAAALKQSIEASTEGLVQILLVPCGGEDASGWNNATYYPASGSDMNYNLMDNSGWGPDYGDPKTYLDTLLPNGYMLKCLGLY